MSAPPRSLAEVIRAGGVAVIGTDTVYGICADAENRQAVDRVLALKGRPQGKPSAVAFATLERAFEALPELGQRTRAALRALLPGPLTALVPNAAGRFPLAGGGELLGLRVIELPAELDRPLLLTSANLSGGREARTLAEVPASLREGADLAIDAGELLGIPSTIVDLGAFETAARWRIVRAGARAQEAVERALLGSRE